MSSHDRIVAPNGHAYRVCFKCRYRNVNTYWVESGCCAGSNVEVTDDGTFYRPPEIGEETAFALVREYETRAWLAHLHWCDENGYQPDISHRHAIARVGGAATGWESVEA